ncbi:MAG: hypothetical protein RJA19_119 [Bacteroidota bacterium]|jgi:cell division protein FtsW
MESLTPGPPSRWSLLTRDQLQGDRVLWMVTFLLSIISVVSVYSAISHLAYKGSGSTIYLGKQVFILCLGWGAMWAVHRLPYRFFAKAGRVLVWPALLLLILTLAFGSNINNANRWLEIPYIGLTIQTPDFAKIMLIAFIARELQAKQKILHDFRRGVLPMLAMTFAMCGLILPGGLSTAVLLGVVAFGMMFVGGVPVRHLLRGVGMVAMVGVAVIAFAQLQPQFIERVFPRYSTWEARVERYVAEGPGTVETGGEATAERADMNMQTDLAQVAVARGGILPKGPGTGTSRNFLPHPYSDMIYAFIIEEWGALVGGLGLVLLYLIFLHRAVLTAVRSTSAFGSTLALGLGWLITLQAMINMAVAVNLIPNTGQPLPLVSYGGTSMVFTCVAIGMILSVSREGTTEKGE